MPVIAYNVLPAEWDRFKAGFLSRYPNPPAMPGMPTYTDDEWINECGRRFFQQAYEYGARRLAAADAQLLHSIFKLGQGAPS